ncbi:MAG: hypothetical protein M3362_06690 [Acidobacteriota bacterium]|nr:hypothetical protein [Acidobacteriota bacterium]
MSVKLKGKAVERPKLTQIRELRVYLDPSTLNALGDPTVFYSRRADGPHYCWFYVEKSGQWDVSRVHMSRLNIKALCVASWRLIPAALQARLIEHYLE